MRVLECSSKGDKRFSAFYARIFINGSYDCIENHYQLSKRVNDFKPGKWQDVKGIKATHFVINNVVVPSKYEEAFYNLMWLKYLDQCEPLVKFAKKFDDYNDMFRENNSRVCQADAIREYIKHGREFMLDKYKEFIEFAKNNNIKDFIIE